MYVGQADTSDEEIERMQRAGASIQAEQERIAASTPGMLKNITIGSMMVFAFIYWALIKR